MSDATPPGTSASAPSSSEAEVSALEDAHSRAMLELVRTDLSDRDIAVRRILETAASTLGIERVGLWFFDDDRTAIVTEDLYVASEDRHSSGETLTAAQYPAYFAALADSRVIAAHDARTDSRTREFADNYLDLFGVTSMLDVPVRSEGRVVGVLCHESVVAEHFWSQGDQEFAGSLADLIGTVIEASRRRRTEEELRELTATLERRVEARTADLQQSNRALLQAVSDLEAFCYSVSHDLRGPLRVINGFASLLEESAVAAADASAREGVERIRENTRRMSDLLDGLLAFFRLGQRPLERQRVDMDGLLRETLTSLDVDLDATAFSARPLAAVEGDPALLSDVLANLLSNAFKFSARRPSPEIEVGCERGEGEVIFHVRDNGVGFETEHATRLFEPFQRLHTRDGYEGTGVGLAIVRRIIERHGGRVWAESAPARGATFRFSIPADEVA